MQITWILMSDWWQNGLFWWEFEWKKIWIDGGMMAGWREDSLKYVGIGGKLAVI